MNYWSLNEESLKDSVIVKNYLQVINKHQDYFNGKNLDDIIKVHWFVENQTGDAAKPAHINSTVLFDFRILRSQMPPQNVMDDLNALKHPPIFVDAF